MHPQARRQEEFEGVRVNPPFDLQKILYTPLNCTFSWLRAWPMIGNCTVRLCVPCVAFHLTCHVVHVHSTAEEPTPSQTVVTVPVSIQPTNNQLAWLHLICVSISFQCHVSVCVPCFPSLWHVMLRVSSPQHQPPPLPLPPPLPRVMEQLPHQSS